MSMVFELAPDVRIYSLAGEATSHLIVYQGRSLLIDCHSAQMGRWLARRGLPVPDMILHTHVQPEHCREADQFPAARSLVHEELAELAGKPLAVFTGDLFCHPVKLVNVYDLESNYGGTAIAALPAVLRELAQRPVQWYLVFG